MRTYSCLTAQSVYASQISSLTVIRKSTPSFLTIIVIRLFHRHLYVCLNIQPIASI